jgi:hypothetical protein
MILEVHIGLTEIRSTVSETKGVNGQAQCHSSVLLLCTPCK